MARPFSRRAGRPRTRGQALVEVALVLPIFLLLLMTLFDFGRVIYAQYTINQDAREGVRRGIVSTGDLKTNALFTARFADIRAAARLMAPAVPMDDSSIVGARKSDGTDLRCSTIAVTPAMPDDGATGACFYPNGVNNPNQLTPPKIVVKITVTVPLITPIISSIVGGSIPLSATSEQLLQ